MHVEDLFVSIYFRELINYCSRICHCITTVGAWIQHFEGPTEIVLVELSDLSEIFVTQQNYTNDQQISGPALAIRSFKHLFPYSSRNGFARSFLFSHSLYCTDHS